VLCKRSSYNAEISDARKLHFVHVFPSSRYSIKQHMNSNKQYMFMYFRGQS
jgi:hypothetical protein